MLWTRSQFADNFFTQKATNLFAQEKLFLIGLALSMFAHLLVIFLFTKSNSIKSIDSSVIEVSFAPTKNNHLETKTVKSPKALQPTAKLRPADSLSTTNLPLSPSPASTTATQPHLVAPPDLSKPIDEAASNSSSSRPETAETIISLGSNESANINSPQARYLQKLKQKISRFQSYPKASRTFQEEGVVKLKISLNRDGVLKNYELIHESSFKRLNLAALELVRKAAPFDKFPEDLPFQDWNITIPIEYKLE